MAHASEKKILVVDDEPDVRHFLAACLEDAGFNVETAVDGVDALEKVKTNTPDLITLDMVMPRRSGINFLRKLRKEKKEWANIPVIVITAHARDEFGSEDIQEFQAFAARHRPRCTLEKPITPSSLVKAISEILDVETDMLEKSRKEGDDNREDLIRMIQQTDPETLKKIQTMLNK
ncbi:MAG: response regulator [Proteobacteria bacterium]|nr:response regulator [Pseudomonadota bacterium]